ncbi:EAL domain-containing protein [bacterium]|nr:EAL domain-containing protein [bacterium]MBU1883953.1 EAL domain-containing protein [bacterium]
MNLFKNIFSISLIGLFVLYALIAYYKYEQKFSSEQRSFTLSLNELNRYNSDLKYNILQSSIFAYYNQDETTEHIELLEKSYMKLRDEEILKNKNYSQVKKSIEELKPVLDAKIDAIRKYLIINAGIKNSFIFLSRQASKSQNYFATNNAIHEQINSLMTLFSNARRIQDESYINMNLKVLHADKNLTEEQKEYITTFNLHATYLLKNFNQFIQLVDNILDDKIDSKTNMIDKEFAKSLQKDMQALNYFATTLIIVLLLLIIIIIYLFVKISHENKLLKAARYDLDYSLTHDKLTDLYNRNAFEKVVLTPDNDYTLLLINIDKFKEVNDLYGNTIGNQVLQEVSKFIRFDSLKYSNAKYFRIGGDEFAILLENMSIQEVKNLADSLSRSIALHRFLISGISINLTVSIAVNDQHPLLENADMALKYIKSFPEVSYIVFDSKMNLLEKIKKNIEIINLVKEAVHDDRVVPFFQPILNIKTKKIEKYEALVRVLNTDGSVIMPLDFLDIIKKTSVYQDITRIMINKVIAVAKDKPYRFSMNISMQDISNEEFMRVFFTQLELNKSSNFNLDIELLETESLYDIAKIEKFIADVKKYGSKVLIDDFGSGYSNFSYFSYLDIDILKVDGSIIKEVLKDDKKLQILKAIHRFAFAIGVDTIAEFVENRGLFDTVEEIGITYAQGYFIGKPSPALLEDDNFAL